MRSRLHRLSISLLIPLLLAARANAADKPTGPQPGNWAAGPWIWTPVSMPQSTHEVMFTPFTETVVTHDWRRRGPRQLAHLHTASLTRLTGDFKIASAEGASLTFAGIYRRQSANRYAREDSRPNDFYSGLILEWRGQWFSVAPTDLPRLKAYVGSTLVPLLDEAPLFAAIRRGDRVFIAAQPDLVSRVMTERDTLGRTLLYRAVQLDDRETIALLLSKGIPADLSNGMPLQQTPLAAAMRLGKLDVLDQLLAAGADPNLPDARGSRPLHVAGQGSKNYRGVIRRLLAAGADPELTNKAGQTPRQRLEKIQAKGWLPILDEEIARHKNK